jgi:hypothetical protein
MVGADHALCPAHDRVLPTDLASAVARAYSTSTPLEQQGPGFWRALQNAQAWITAHYGVQTERPRPSWAALKAAVRQRDVERNARRGQPPPVSVDPAPASTSDDDATPPTPQQELFR